MYPMSFLRYKDCEVHACRQGDVAQLALAFT
jgi:hypothetical protein